MLLFLFWVTDVTFSLGTWVLDDPCSHLSLSLAFTRPACLSRPSWPVGSYMWVDNSSPMHGPSSLVEAWRQTSVTKEAWAFCIGSPQEEMTHKDSGDCISPRCRGKSDLTSLLSGHVQGGGWWNGMKYAIPFSRWSQLLNSSLKDQSQDLEPGDLAPESGFSIYY